MFIGYGYSFRRYEKCSAKEEYTADTGREDGTLAERLSQEKTVEGSFQTERLSGSSG